VGRMIRTMLSRTAALTTPLALLAACGTAAVPDAGAGQDPAAGFCPSSTPYCADAKAVLTEMRHYGLILADNGSNWFFQGSAFPQWPSALVSLLKQIPARAFQAIDESCLMVSPKSGRAAAKPGCPIG
jgi:hypothetical protein